jgi:two-component system, OmpR family, response regulator MprA
VSVDAAREGGARVLVVDDDPGVVNVVSRGLSVAGFQVREELDGESALRTLERWSPDCLVLDIVMPGIDGLTVCRRARTADPGVGILMLTAKDATMDQVVGLESGADDYLAKPFAMTVLVARVRAILRRREPQAGATLRYDDLELNTSAHVAARAGRDIHLTATEYKLLHEFMRAPEQILSKSLLTDRVWGYDFEGNHNVLEVYVRYLREKLEVDGAARLIHTLRHSGYVLRRAAP